MSHTSSAGGESSSEAAREEADRLRQRSREESREVAATGREQAQRVVDEARGQARSLVEEARAHAMRQAEEQTSRLSGALGEWSRQADALLDGRPDEAGTLGQWAREASSQLHRLADRVDELGFRGVMDEVGRFARRRPGAFLLSTAAAGFAASRLGRGAQEASPPSDSSPTASRSRTGGASPSGVPSVDTAEQRPDAAVGEVVEEPVPPPPGPPAAVSDAPASAEGRWTDDRR